MKKNLPKKKKLTVRKFYKALQLDHSQTQQRRDGEANMAGKLFSAVSCSEFS